LFFSPSEVWSLSPVQPTPQRSCQLAGSPRRGRAYPTLSAKWLQAFDQGGEVRGAQRADSP
jgi:hypothetical protein